MDFYKTVDIYDNVCIITYDNINKYNWERIRNNSLILSEAGIGPKIYDIVGTSITYQHINILNVPYHPTLTLKQLGDQARSMVEYMHDVLDIAHTDLAPSNIGYIGEKLYFIDHDELFRISEGITPWTQELMDRNECTFDELVASDYNRFRRWI